MSGKKLMRVEPGDIIIRNLAGCKMELRVSSVDEHIHCGPWTFSKRNGAEIDPDLGWDEKRTGSYIERVLEPMPDDVKEDE